MLSLLLFLLGIGFVTGRFLSQTPSRVICKSGTSVTIQCHQVKGQDAFMFWYQQLPGQSLIMLATANQDSEATYESGFTKAKFPISRPNLTFSTLTVHSVSLQDSSLYLCSSGSTMLDTDQIPEQELSFLLASSYPEKPEDPAKVN